jgi:asparagine synthase (glutamine-hydrolysing)
MHAITLEEQTTMHMGFTAIWRHDQVEFRRYGPCPADRPALVTWAREGEQSAILMGRLYYCAELLAHLPEKPLQPEAWRDVDLALAAYRCWGAAGIERLEGDFALVIWDARRNRLLGARDPLGGYPLFWIAHGGTFALSTGVAPLLELLPSRSLSLDYLAEFLTLPFATTQEVPTEHCVYKGIHRVPGGTLLQVRLPAAHVEQHAYWNWQEHILDPGTDRLEAMSEQVADRLRQAVAQRLRGRTAAHLSGGMDSTGVALLARDCLAAGSGEPLHTLSLVYDTHPLLARETPYIERALQHQPGIVAHRVLGDACLHYDSVVDPPMHDEPCPGLHSLGLERPLLETVAQVGAATVLTGLGGDDLWEIPPYHIHELLRRGRLWAAWREASAWALATTNSPWRFLYRCGVAPGLPVWLRAGVGPLWRGGYASWQRQGEGTLAPWIRPAFARTQALRERSVAHLRRYASGRPGALSPLLAALKVHTGDTCRWYMAAPHGVVLTHPFLDPRLVQLSLGMRLRFRQEPGQQKPLLAQALRDVLPAAIRNRRDKGHFNEIYFAGLARHLPTLETLVRRAPVDDVGCVDKDVLVECLRQAALGVDPSGYGVSQLEITLSLLAWLSLQEKGHGSPPPLRWKSCTLTNPAIMLHVGRGLIGPPASPRSRSLAMAQRDAQMQTSLTILSGQTPPASPHQAAYRLAPDVLLVGMPDATARLLDMGGQCYAMPVIAAQMLQGVLQHSTAATVHAIAAQYGADVPQVQQDLQVFVRDLAHRRLIQPAHTVRQRPQNSALAGMLGLPLRGLVRCRLSLKVKAAVLLMLARLSFASLGWARSIALWDHALGQGAAHERGEGGEETVKAVDQAVRRAAATYPLRMACKERALCCWVLARAAGLAATLVVGIQLFPLAGHCWCEIGAWTLSDERARCDPYIPVIRYASALT